MKIDIVTPLGRIYQGEIKELSLKLFAKKIRQYTVDLKLIEEEFSTQAENKTSKNI